MKKSPAMQFGSWSLARLISRLSRFCAQAFQIKTKTVQFPSQKRRRRNFRDQGGDGTTFATIAETARLPKPKRDRGPTFQTKANAAQFSRTRRRLRDQETVPRDQDGDAAIFQTKANAARFSWPMRDGATFRPKGRWREFPVHGSCGAIFQNKGHAARFSNKNISSCVPFGGYGASFQANTETAGPRKNF